MCLTTSCELIPGCPTAVRATRSGWISRSVPRRRRHGNAPRRSSSGDVYPTV